MRASFLLIAAFVLASGARTWAASITFHNTSSSHYQVRDESAGNAIVVNNTSRQGSSTYTLPDSHNYRLYIGTPGDQGTHYFKTDASGNIAWDPSNPESKFFYDDTPTSLTIGSIPVYLRQLSGTVPETVVGGGGTDTYFATTNITALGAAGQLVVNLAPDDRAGTPFNTGFTGVWKNIFPYNFVQQTPMDLGPLTGVSGGHYGIRSMTNVHTPSQTTITSSTLVTFFEGGKHYRGFQFTVDRVDGAQAGDGSEFLFFTEIPEPTGATALAVIGAAALLRRRGA
jgi:hypothetical protein